MNGPHWAQPCASFLSAWGIMPPGFLMGGPDAAPETASGDMSTQTYRLMTYNIGGGRDPETSPRDLIAQVIREAEPDVLAIQEAVRRQDFDGRWHDDVEALRLLLGEDACAVFAPTVTLQAHLHTRKKALLDALYADDRDWQMGNALISRWPFHRFRVPDQPGPPRDVPLFRPKVYEGTRNSDPRSALLARIGAAPDYPIVIATHLTTLLGEREKLPVPGVAELAAALRLEQTRQIAALITDEIRASGQIVFLMGDLNATLEEASIRQVLIEETGFLAFDPGPDCPGTHPKVKQPIDHVLAFPAERIEDYACRIVDTETSRAASDHLPVCIEVAVRPRR